MEGCSVKQFIALSSSFLDPEKHHDWVPSALPVRWLERASQRFEVNFLKSTTGRLLFLHMMEADKRVVARCHRQYGRTVMSYEMIHETDDEERFIVIVFSVYPCKKAKPYLYYFGKCKLAQRATERALAKQVHKDVIPLIGDWIWASRWEKEWM